MKADIKTTNKKKKETHYSVYSEREYWELKELSELLGESCPVFLRDFYYDGPKSRNLYERGSLY